MALALFSGCSQSPPPQAVLVRKVEWHQSGQWLKIDTHLHSKFSDGRESMDTIAQRAVAHGCDAIAFTDHSDRDLIAATPEYLDQIRSLRRKYPDLVVLAGVEWNLPPFGGDEHMTLLVSPRVEDQVLAPFKFRFDDLDRPVHDPALADEAIRWLGKQDEDVPPVLIWNHPSRKLAKPSILRERLTEWSRISPLVIGFSGAPGHQKQQPVGDYELAGADTKNRWDRLAAEAGGTWDQLTTSGIRVSAARAASDFHNADDDFWPGEFSSTYVLAPEKSEQGVLRGLHAGAMFAGHGNLVQQAELVVNAPGLPRPAIVGEQIELALGASFSVSMRLRTPVGGGPLRRNIHQIELIIAAAGADAKVQVIELTPEQQQAAQRDTIVVELGEFAAPAKRVVVRARLRSRHEMPRQAPVSQALGGSQPANATTESRNRLAVTGAGDLCYYTNPIYIDRLTSSVTPSSIGRFLPSWFVPAFSVLVVLLFAGGVGWMFYAAEPQRRPAERVNRWWLAAGAMMSISFLLYGSIVPLDWRDIGFAAAWQQFLELPRWVRPSRTDVAVNIAVAVPIGYFIAGMVAFQSRSSLLLGLAAVLVFVIGFPVSVTCEYLQVMLQSRSPTMTDIYAQAFGYTVGWALWIGIGNRFIIWLDQAFSRDSEKSKLEWWLQCYVVGLLIYTLTPFSFAVAIDDIAFQIRNRIEWIPFSDWRGDFSSFYALIRDTLVFVPVGLLASIWGRPARRHRGLLATLPLGFLFVAATECAQLVVVSRYTTVTDIILGTIGFGMGVTIPRWFPYFSGSQTDSVSVRSVRGIVLAGCLGLYLLLPVAVGTYPFKFQNDPAVVRRSFEQFVQIPFISINSGSRFAVVSVLIRDALLYIPIGVLASVLLSQLSPRMLPAWIRQIVVVVFGFAVSLAIEIGQLFLPDRVAELADVIFAILGTIIGVWLAALLVRVMNPVSAGSDGNSSSQTNN